LGVQWQQTSIVHHVGQLLINTVTGKVKYEIKFVLFGFSGDHFRLISSFQMYVCGACKPRLQLAYFSDFPAQTETRSRLRVFQTYFHADFYPRDENRRAPTSTASPFERARKTRPVTIPRGALTG
jgi:hypothetical protein